MKTCPKCRTEYSDDFYFCLNDGHVLADKASVQETVMSKKVSMKTCPKCRTEYSDGLYFCLNDGHVLADKDGVRETVISKKIFTEPTPQSPAYGTPQYERRLSFEILLLFAQMSTAPDQREFVLGCLDERFEEDRAKKGTLYALWKLGVDIRIAYWSRIKRFINKQVLRVRKSI